MKREVIEGKINGNERGYAFLLPLESGRGDFFIPHCDLRGAMHGDTVLAETTTDGERTSAKVLKIINRGIDKLVGTYFSKRTGGFVVPDERKYFTDIFVPFGKGLKAKTGDKVVCKITDYPKKRSPEGLIVRVLGRQLEKQAELKSILFTYNLKEKFPKPCLDEVEELSDITSQDLIGRKDFRELTTFTIDGEDARDFDDAVSIEILPNGNYKLGVHIADVSHYVKYGSEIDKEAFNRGNSTYFPENVIPMLPERLCNDLCSLKQGVDRLTLSCVMTVDEHGNVVDYEIAPSVINSKFRTTYNQVQKMLDGDMEVIEQFKPIYNDVLLMSSLAKILNKKRSTRGCIDLDVKESSIYVDNDGSLHVEILQKNDARNLIEEFMILANVTVAEYMYFLEKPFIYRVHERPSEEKANAFYKFLDTLGVRAKRNKDKLFSKDFQTILEITKDTPVNFLVNRVMLRSMQKAKYSPVNVGHFGLSEERYCHFTSPIRRYPDLVIHSIIKDFLAGKNVEEKYLNYVETASTKASECERNSDEAERACDDYYKALYISNYVGEEFNGVISGVTNFGIFVELENGIEGLIKTETLNGKNYTFNPDTFTLSNGRNSYKLGNQVKILVSGVDIMSKRIEFLLAE